MKNEKMMREASPIKLLFTMGLPTIVVMIVQVLYNMADVFFIGQGGDAMQVAALSLSGPAFNIFQGVGTLFGAGSYSYGLRAGRQGEGEILQRLLRLGLSDNRRCACGGNARVYGPAACNDGSQQ